MINYLHRNYWIMYLAWVSFCFTLLILLPKGHCVLFINDLHFPFGDLFFKYATYLGDGWVYALLTLFFVFYERRFLWAILVTSISQLFIVQGLKKMVFSSFPRPVSFFGEAVELNAIEGVRLLTHHSFPSGHTASAFSFAILLGFVFKDKVWSVFFVFIGVIGGVSRVYLNLHFLMDITAGSFIGLFTAFLGIWSYLKIVAKN